MVPVVINSKIGNDKSRMKFDWTINITTLIGIVVISITIVKFGTEGLAVIRDIQAKTNVMWVEYAKTHPDAAAVMKAYHDKEN